MKLTFISLIQVMTVQDWPKQMNYFQFLTFFTFIK